MESLRQGDVLLRRISSLPPEAKESDDRVLARGEVTGHSHRIENGKVFRGANNQLLVLAEQETKLVHEEHRQIEVPRGVYEVVRQREYDPIMERQVTD